MDLLIIHSFADRHLLLLAALLVSALLMGPLPFYRWLGLEKPERFLVRVILRLEQKLNRSKRSAGTRIYRGMILLGFMLIAGLLFSLLIHSIARNWEWGEYIELLILAYLMPLRHSWDLSRTVSIPLSRQQEPAAGMAVAVLTRRVSANMDTHTTVRITIEYLMQRLADSVIAPALWYLALGLPAVILVRLIGLLDAQLGYRNDRLAMFGWSIARLDDLLQLIPARLCALIICLASFFIPRCRPFHALGILLFHARRTVSPNRGHPLAAAAGALNISLGGPRRLSNDALIEDGWLGKGTAKATLHDLVRAQWLYVASALIFILFLAASLMIPAQLTIPELFSF